jgi:surface protein
MIYNEKLMTITYVNHFVDNVHEAFTVEEIIRQVVPTFEMGYTSNQPLATGHVGPNATYAPWTLYDNGVVEVGGGRIRGINTLNSPWAAHRGDITRIVFTEPVTAGADMRGLFRDLTNLTEIRGLQNVDMSGAARLDSMFRNTGLRTLDLSNWNMSSVWETRNMFHSSSDLVSINGLENWNTSAFQDMRYMFAYTHNLAELNVGGWDVSNATDMQSTFRFTSSLTSLDIGAWQTRNVHRMHSLFNGSGVHSLDISNWDTGRVTNMESMFRRTPNLTELDINNWNIESLINITSIFRESGIVNLDLSNWDTSNVQTMANAFRDGVFEVINISNWCTSSLRSGQTGFYGMANIFARSPNELTIRQLTLGEGWYTRLGTPNLPPVPNNDTYTGLWVNSAGVTATSAQLMGNTLSAEDIADTWVWQAK